MNIKFLNKQTTFNYSQLPENVVYPLMCHGSDVLIVKSLQEAKQIKPRTYKADAVVTTSDEVLLVMPTADCAPIVLIDKEKNILAMMHCGWKPSLRGLIENTIAEMESLGASVNNIHAIIGPSIDIKSFECKDDMRDLFLAQNKDNSIFFKSFSSQTWGFDLRQYCQVKLYSLGIKRVEVTNIDTFSNPLYHSYRQYCHKFGKGFKIGKKNGAFMNLNQASL